MISLLAILATLILLIGGTCVFFYGFRFASSEPNQWMLVIRNGRVIKSGVGINSYIYWGDKVVKFPSRINKVKFSAQQVTQEMQGIEVSGVIIWAIYRDEDGPSRAYKMLGDDLKQNVPRTANDNLIEMANSIVRDRIANSTIDTIIKQRSKIRDEIRSEMNKVVNGWGVWLESIEITDVKILSNALFKNLQTEFREQQRQKAELIQMKITREIEEKRLAQNTEMSKKRADDRTEIEIYQREQDLKIKEKEQNIFERDQEIMKQRLDSEQKLKLHRLDNNQKYNDEVKAKEQANRLAEIARDMEQEKKGQELDDLRAETRRKEVMAENERSRLKEEQVIELERKQLEMKNEMYEKTKIEFHAMNMIQEIYRNLPITEMKVYNFGDGKKDPVGNIVGQIMATVNEMKQQ